jgi:hypothetical protein
MSGKVKIWIIPILLTLLVFALALFIRTQIGNTDEQDLNYGTKPFVPGESPYSTGEHSR